MNDKPKIITAGSAAQRFNVDLDSIIESVRRDKHGDVIGMEEGGVCWVYEDSVRKWSEVCRKLSANMAEKAHK